jgi:excinuclease ABC subunit C
METVGRNAGQALARHKLQRAGDLTVRSQALEELQQALDLDEAPLRIECYDVSHHQGAETVASMVVFEDGLPRKGEYRRFAIRGVDGNDDTAAMHEVITRRFRRYLEERSDLAEPELGDDSEDRADRESRADPGAGGQSGFGGLDPDTGRPRKFAYPPQLVVVDGGPPQVAAAARAMAELGIEDVALAGLAKRLEEVWLPGSEHPVVLPRSSEGLYLLQRVRDEAHRFAITFHRQRRSKTMTASALDSVAGLGSTRRTALLRHFGSLKRVREASAEQIAEVPGIGAATAQAVVEALAGQPARRPAVNVATGEILDDDQQGPAAGEEGP